MSNKMTAEQQEKIQKELAKRAAIELWRRGDLSYKYHAGQKHIMSVIDALDPSVREILLFISRRWGKSFLGSLLAIQTAQAKWFRRVLIMGPTEKQTKEIINPIFQKIKLDDYENLLKETKSESKWKIGKSEIQLAGFDTAIESVRGQEFDLIILEEPASAKITREDYDYIIKSVLRPTLMHTKGRIIYMTTPGKNADHPLHVVTIPKTQASGSFFKFTIEDNILLTKEEIEAEIEDMGGRDDPSVRRELFCEILRDEASLAIPKFDVNMNVQEFELPELFHCWVAGDFGGVRDKTVLHLWAYDFKNARKLIIDELVFDRNTPTSEIALQLFTMEKKYGQDGISRWIDCPGQTRVDLQNDHGLIVNLPLKQKGSFEAGVNQINLACMDRSVLVHPRCKFTIMTLENGRTNKQRTDYERTEDLGHCDALASMAYGLRHADVENPFPRLHHLRHVKSDDLLDLGRDPTDPFNTLFED